MIINHEAAFQLSETFSSVMYEMLPNVFIFSSNQTKCANFIRKD